ncbi:Protein APN-1 [Aphelenchoides avenae]|nr:Protein APN-1 [Aphelenchus avenae]
MISGIAEDKPVITTVKKVEATPTKRRPVKQAVPPSPKKPKAPAEGISDAQVILRDTVGAQVLSKVRDSKKMLGVHASAAGSLEQAIFNGLTLGCRSIALFVKNQRRWDSKPMDEDVVVRWKRALEDTGFSLDHIVPHGSYLMNPGTSNDALLTKTRHALLDECLRCERLGIKYYNFHPGSSCGLISREECIKNVAETINYVHERTTYISLVVETMCGQGHTVGGTFQDLRDVIDQVNDKSRVGVCIDTCHIFAAGYDLRTPESYEATMTEFANVVGFQFLKAVHLNDSKGALGSHLDRHENIGAGQLGLASFKHMMKDARFDNVPMILETPEGMYASEMETLYDLQFA